MKKLVKCICVLVVMGIVFSLPVAAYDKTEMLKDNAGAVSVMTPEMAVKEIEAMKKEFPEAQLSAAAAKEFATKMSPLSVEEQLAYYAELKKAGPKQTLEKVYSDGRIVTLDVYSPMVATQKTFTPGSTRDGGNVTYYTKSRIDVKNLEGYLSLNVHYYVDHYKYSYGVGQVSDTYSFSGNGNGLVTLGGYYYDQRSGSQAVVRVELHTSGVGIGDGSAYLGDIKIVFSASSFAINTAWVL